MEAIYIDEVGNDDWIKVVTRKREKEEREKGKEGIKDKKNEGDEGNEGNEGGGEEVEESLT